MFLMKNVSLRKCMELLPVLLALALLCAGCSSSRRGTAGYEKEPVAVADLTDSDDGTKSEFVILTGVISFDSLKSAYNIEIDNQTRVDGFLNLEGEPIPERDVKGLNYVQLAQDSSVVSIHRMENPLVQSMEYHDGPVMGRKTVRLEKAVLFLRVQLSERTEKIAFRNDKSIIKVIDLEK